MSEIRCKICGSLKDPNQYVPKLYKGIHEDYICRSCIHWNEQLLLDREVRGSHGWVVINGTHYVIPSEDRNKHLEVPEGHEFRIKFFDGTEVITRNLKCQGDIPEYWKDKFPNNATFIQD